MLEIIFPHSFYIACLLYVQSPLTGHSPQKPLQPPTLHKNLPQINILPITPYPTNDLLRIPIIITDNVPRSVIYVVETFDNVGNVDVHEVEELDCAVWVI